MTIEAKIEALTAAIAGLHAALDKASAAVKGKSVSPSVDAAAPAAPMKAPTPPKADAKALTYDDVKVPFLALVKKDRDLALETLKPFGLDSLKPAKPEQFTDILAALTKALG